MELVFIKREIVITCSALPAFVSQSSDFQMYGLSKECCLKSKGIRGEQVRKPNQLLH